MRTMRTLLLLAASALFAFGCGKDEPPAAAAPEPAAEPAVAPAAEPTAEPEAPAEPEAAADPEAPTPAQTLMRGHFQQAGETREALLRADIETAKRDMNWLATHNLGAALPGELQPLLKAMQESAGEFAKAKNLREAGVALATTLTKCGACHKQTGKGPTFAVPALPEGEAAAQHMQRHHWAANRMWEGLVNNDEDAFQSAAAVLGEGPVDPALLAPPENVKAKVEELTKHLHAVGKEATEAKDPEARAAAYGNFLATCATCHRMLGRGPKPVAEVTE